ncbi:MAG: hypothetical protein C0482_16075 [Gordonia sp.]|nr:hypothetical protein [Gordonia sp. (in: high G+C Gram-positive bacteria)]
MADETGKLSVDDLHSISERLSNRWSEYLEDTPTTNGDEATRAWCVYGLAMHTTNLLSLVAGLHTTGVNPMFLMPQVRTMYETAITAQWIALVEDGANAWINASQANSARLIDNLRKSSDPIFTNAADSIQKARIMDTALPSTSDHQAGNFKSLCADLNIGDTDAYSYYKLLCAYTHPSVDLADEYLVQPEGQNAAIVRQPKMTPTDAWFYLAAASTVWAQMAMQLTAKDPTFRNHLRSIARELGVEDTFQPSDAAWLRLHKK